MNRDLIVQAFPGQPRMQAAFEALVNDAEDATTRLTTALEAISSLSGGAGDILADLAARQPRNDTLDAISILGPDPGVLEQVQAGIFAVRPIDAADVKSLITRELADTRYLGGAHAAASATKLATARSITASGDAAWTVSFDGSANVSAALTLATVNANTGTFGGAKTSAQVSLDGKGRVTSASAVTITPDYSSIGIVPTSRFLGRVTAGTGSAEALTGTQATTLLDTFTSALKGLVPASGGGTTNFLRADGTWAAAGSSVTPAALTKTDDTNVTLTLGGTPTTALLQGVSVTVGWAGSLALARGGTGQTTKLGAIAALRSACMAKKSADQIAANYTTGPIVTWDAESYDDDAWHDNVTNNSRLTVPTGVTRVRVGCNLKIANGTAGVSIIVSLLKNGVSGFDGSVTHSLTSAGATPGLSLASGPITVAATDYFEISLFYGTDTSIDITAAQSNFWIEAA